MLIGVLEVASAFVLPAPIVWRYPQESYLSDPRLIHRLKPNQQAFTQSSPVVINWYGLRNEMFSLRPRPGTSRILCLGDSLTFGNGVALAETYPKQLEKMLNASGEGPYEVINAGTPAYDTWQELIYLREYGLQLEPDLVIVGFYANDIMPIPAYLARRGRVVTSEEQANELKPRANRAILWLKRSRLLLFSRARLTQLMNRISPPSDVSHKLALLHGTPNDLADAGWRQIDNSFRELATLATAHRFEVLVVFFPIEDQVLAKYPSASYPKRAKEIAARYNIPTLDLLPAFAREFTGFSSLFIEWDGHPNARAYAIAAREINAYLMSPRAEWNAAEHGTLRAGARHSHQRYPSANVQSNSNLSIGFH